MKLGLAKYWLFTFHVIYLIVNKVIQNKCIYYEITTAYKHKLVWGHSITTLTWFCLFLTTYLPPRGHFFIVNVDQNWQFLTTYPPHLVHVFFERPLCRNFQDLSSKHISIFYSGTLPLTLIVIEGDTFISLSFLIRFCQLNFY